MTNKKLFLSNSQVDTYLTCQRKWWNQKIQRLRPAYLSSPLYFGTLLDRVTEYYLLEDKSNWKEFYSNLMLSFEVNGKPKKLPEDILDIRFGAGDCDEALIDQDELNKFCEDLDLEPIIAKEYLEYCKGQRKKKKALEETEQKLFNYCAFLSLKQKGLMLLEKLTGWLDENVAEVISVQKKIEISNDNGDKFIGYLDFVVKIGDMQCRGCQGTGLAWDDVDNRERQCGRCPPHKTVLIDLKTSSNPKLYYPEDAASKSRQLGIYSQEEGIPDVAYLIGDKNIRKTDSKSGPRVRLSYVEGVITEEHLDDVFEEIEGVTAEIKEKLLIGEKAFAKNLDSCNNYSGCEYKGLCHRGSKKGLEEV